MRRSRTSKNSRNASSPSLKAGASPTTERSPSLRSRCGRALGQDPQNSQSAIAEMTRALERYRLQRAEAESAAQTMRQRETTAIEDLNEIRVRVATGRQQLENLNRQRGPMAARLTELTENPGRAPCGCRGPRVSEFNHWLRKAMTLARSAEVWREEVAALQANVTECLSARSEAHEKSGPRKRPSRRNARELSSCRTKKEASRSGPPSS